MVTCHPLPETHHSQWHPKITGGPFAGCEEEFPSSGGVTHAVGCDPTRRMTRARGTECTAPYLLTYDFPLAVREKLRNQWGGDWKGQVHKWFLFKLTKKEEEINLLGDGIEKPEIVDFTKPVYKEVLAIFAPYLE
ncbi:hypothetical protein UlMin_028932 [Ulmus minor]